MHSKQLTRLAPLVAALWCGALPCRAEAAPSAPQRPAAEAQALYDRAVVSMEAHDYASACPALEEVVRLVPDGIGAKLTLAECYEGWGRLASAWTMYSLAEAGARNGKQRQRAEAARRLAGALEPKLARLTIEVPGELRKLPGLTVERDGVVVGEVQWGVPLPVDRGEHRVAASAPGRPRWEKQVVVAADGVSETVEIAGWQAAASPAAGPRADSAPRPDAGAPWGIPRIAGIAVTGLGLVSLGVGAFFGLRAAGLKSDSDDGHCRPDDACDVEGVALRDDARSAGTVSTVLFIAGGVAVAGGAVLFLTAPDAHAAPTAALAVGPGGLTLRAAW
jgi:hypothetical protein